MQAGCSICLPVARASYSGDCQGLFSPLAEIQAWDRVCHRFDSVIGSVCCSFTSNMGGAKASVAGRLQMCSDTSTSPTPGEQLVSTVRSAQHQRAKGADVMQHGLALGPTQNAVPARVGVWLPSQLGVPCLQQPQQAACSTERSCIFNEALRLLLLRRCVWCVHLCRHLSCVCRVWQGIRDR